METLRNFTQIVSYFRMLQTLFRSSYAFCTVEKMERETGIEPRDVQLGKLAFQPKTLSLLGIKITN